MNSSIRDVSDFFFFVLISSELMSTITLHVLLTSFSIF